MRKWTKFFCFIFSLSLLLTYFPDMDVSAAVGASGFYCDFDEIPLRSFGEEVNVNSSHFTSEGLAFVDNVDGIIIEDRGNDGNRGIHLHSSAAVGASMPTSITKGQVKVTLTVYPMALATYVYLATDMGGSLGDSTKVTIGKFGNNFTLGTSGPTKAMTQNKYNRIELVVDIDSNTLTGYFEGECFGTLTDIEVASAEGVIVGGNAVVATSTTNKPLIGDLGISSYRENDTFSCVNSEDVITDGLHTTTVMFDEPVDIEKLPAASAISIAPSAGGASFTAESIEAYGPVAILTWRGEMLSGTEYRIDFGDNFKSVYGRALEDGAYLTGPLSTATTTLIDENFNSLSTQTLDVTTGFNTATGIYLLGGDSHEVTSDVAQTVANAEALCFSKSDDETYDEPRYLKMPRSDAAYPYGTDPYTAANGDYAAVPYQPCHPTASNELYYKVGDLTKTELGGMPATGIVRWSFDYLWEQGSGTSALSTNYYLKWGGEEITGWSGTTLNKLLYNASNDTNTWNSVVVEYDASNKKVRYAATEEGLGAWADADMSKCDWLVLPAELSVQRLSFAIDNVKVTWTSTPLYVEGVRCISRDGAVTGAANIDAETEEIKVYFSAPVSADIINHVELNESAIVGTLSSDKKVLTIKTGLFKGNTTVTVDIDEDAASEGGIKIAEAKSYTFTTREGRFALENLGAVVSAANAGTITSGDKVTITADAVNTIGNSQSYTFVFAYYNGGKLVDLGYVACTLSAEEYAKAETHVLYPVSVGAAYDKVKVFAWNSIAEHNALAEAVSY